MNKISCIVPTYNQIEYLPECILSILRQTYPNFEVIIVNDGSTDGTKEYLDSVESQYNLKVLHHKSNKGIANALNTGLDLCIGDYITWMSSDCFYEKEAFSVMAEALTINTDCGLVSTNFNIFGSRDIDIIHGARKYTYEDMKVGNFVGNCFLFRRKYIDEGLRFDTDFLCVEDWKMWLEISLRDPILKIPGIYAHWRDHKSNLSNTKGYSIGVINSNRLKEKYRDAKGNY